MRKKYFWLLITLLVFVFSNSLGVRAGNRLELSYESTSRALPYYEMTVVPVHIHDICRLGLGPFDYSRSSGQTLRYLHSTELRGRPAKVQLSLGQEQAEGSWSLTESGGYWYRESEDLNSKSMQGTFTYFVSQNLGLKVGFAREELDHQGFWEDNRPSWLRGDWTRKDKEDTLILGLEIRLSENFKVGCSHLSLQETQDFGYFRKSTYGNWWRHAGEGKFRGNGWSVEATYLPRDFLRLELLSNFRDSDGDFEDIVLTSEGEEFLSPYLTSTNSFRKANHSLILNFPVTGCLSLELGYLIHSRNYTYRYLDNSTLDYDLQKNGCHCGFQLLISPHAKFKATYSHANLKRKDDWYCFSEEAPGWQGKGNEDRTNLHCIFEF